MAEVNEQENATIYVDEAQQSLGSLLCNEERDFLIKNTGEKVPVSELVGKTVALYFSAHWCPPCRGFTPELIQLYNTLRERGEAFEIVFLSSDREQQGFEEYFASMPWLALPFGDETKKELSRIFSVKGIPSLIVIGPDGKTVTTDGRRVVTTYGPKAYPFTAERLRELEAEEEAIRAAQTVESLLVSEERDYVIAHGGGKVPVSELVGKIVCLYFSAHWCPPCRNFTPQLIDFYNELKNKGEALEIIFISVDREEQAFEEYYGSMPWLALPFGDKIEKNLFRYFQIQGIPTLIVLNPNGKTIQTEGVELIEDYGILAYPFTAERLDELKAQEEAKRETQTLESLLVSEERNFLVKHGGGNVQVSELVGKTVALYFSAHWCPPCRGFTPNLIQVYNELKERGEAFEIVFISSDKDQNAFEEYFASMPWLALPYGDKLKKDLNKFFRVEGIPTLIVIGPDGKTVTTDARSLVSRHGAKAYPFTTERLEKLQKEIEESAGKMHQEGSKPGGVICEGDVCFKA
eukprot:Gb_39281 [translate_table: standard]